MAPAGQPSPAESVEVALEGVPTLEEASDPQEVEAAEEEYPPRHHRAARCQERVFPTSSACVADMAALLLPVPAMGVADEREVL